MAILCARQGYAFCCTQAWDEECILEYANVLGGVAECGTRGTCSHDICTTGVYLPTACSPCVVYVCMADTRNICCSDFGEWDAVCVSLVPSACGVTCP